MYREEKDSRSRKAHRETTAPSFSSTDKPEAFKKQSAYVVDKWIQKSKSQKFISDVMFFSSTSSSNSDSSGALSSSDTEFFGSQTEPKVSCFSTRPKPIKTARKPTDPVKTKSRALRLYANLKQPISPGGSLTSFISSLFSNAAGKKPKNEAGKDRFQSRSCLSNSSPGSRERMTRRTVRFNPIVDDDSMACGHKSAFDGKYQINLPVADLKLKGYNRKMSDKFSVFRESVIVDEEEDDWMSDASSDLFELDHMAMFGNKLKCEELPVYETTRMQTNRVIASRLIR